MAVVPLFVTICQVLSVAWVEVKKVFFYCKIDRASIK